MPNALVVHSTEGSTIAGAVATMEANNSSSHAICDPKTGEFRELLSWDRPARSLRNRSGGVETNNRPGIWQLEVVGRAEHIPTYDDVWHEQLADWIRWLCETLDVPLVAPYPFKPYPESYGLDNGLRISNAEWATVEGIIGHQHIPENTHGDPGDISRTLAHLIGDTPPMAPADTLEAETKFWQRWLNSLGIDPPLKIDGDRGPLTNGAAGTISARYKSFETELAERIELARAQAERIASFESAAQSSAAVLTETQAQLAAARTRADTAEARLAELEESLDDELSAPPDVDPATQRKAERHDQLALLIYQAVVDARGLDVTE